MELQEISSRNAVLVTEGERPSFRWSDLWRAPLNDFPIRDEILYQFLPLRADMKILEIGPGSGFTAFRLSRRVESVTLVDTSEEAVNELQRKLQERRNIRYVRADLSEAGLEKRLKDCYDVAFALDVFEYVKDPATGLLNFAQALRPGGELFLTFPNCPPPIGDGVTYFRDLHDLDRMLGNAGFSQWNAFTVELRPYAAWVYRMFHEMPFHLCRRIRAGSAEGRPQTFDRVWSFRNRKSLERLRIPVQFAWMLLAWIMQTGGDAFSCQEATAANLQKQIVIRAWK